MYKAIIVEDDPMVASINTQYLQKNSLFRIVRTFGNGQAALDYLKNHSVDLAIIDYYMPVVNGLEFIRLCRETDICLDIIMITAANSASEISDIMRLGVIDYLVKPFTYERFCQAIRKFLDLRNAFRSEKQLSQEEIDRLLSSNHPTGSGQKLLDKGLQQKTLDLIQEFLKNHKDAF